MVVFVCSIIMCAITGTGSWEACGPGGTKALGVCSSTMGTSTVLFTLCDRYTLNDECMMSTDNGETWTLSAELDFDGQSIFSDDYGRIFIGGEDYILLSPDTGDSWAKIYTAEGARIHSFAVDPANQLHILAAASGCDSPLLESTDGGYGWSAIPAPGEDLQGRAVAFAPGESNVIWFACDTPALSNMLAAYKSTDGGDTWEELSPEAPYSLPSNPEVDIIIAADSHNRVCMNASRYIFYTDDGGQTWSLACNADSYIGDLCSVENSPGIVYGVTGYGFYASNDYGSTWEMTSLLPANGQGVTATLLPEQRIHVAALDGIYHSAIPQGEWIPSSCGIPGGDVYCLLENGDDESGFPVFTGFDFLLEDQYGWSPGGELPLAQAWHLERSYSDPDILYAAGDAG